MRCDAIRVLNWIHLFSCWAQMQWRFDCCSLRAVCACVLLASYVLMQLKFRCSRICFFFFFFFYCLREIEHREPIKPKSIGCWVHFAVASCKTIGRLTAMSPRKPNVWLCVCVCVMDDVVVFFSFFLHYYCQPVKITSLVFKSRMRLLIVNSSCTIM